MLKRCVLKLNLKLGRVFGDLTESGIPFQTVRLATERLGLELRDSRPWKTTKSKLLAERSRRRAGSQLSILFKTQMWCAHKTFSDILATTTAFSQLSDSDSVLLNL